MSLEAGTPFLRRDASRPDLRYHCRWRDQTASPVSMSGAAGHTVGRI